MTGALVELKDYLGMLPDHSPAKITQLTVMQKAAVLLHLQGRFNNEIAEEVGRGATWVSKVLRSKPALQLVEDYYQFADREFKSCYMLAIKAVRDGLMSGDLDVRLKAADKFFKAHGKYEKKGDQRAETAEDVIARILNVVLKGQTNEQLPRPQNIKQIGQGGEDGVDKR